MQRFKTFLNIYFLERFYIYAMYTDRMFSYGVWMDNDE